MKDLYNYLWDLSNSYEAPYGCFSSNFNDKVWEKINHTKELNPNFQYSFGEFPHPDMSGGYAYLVFIDDEGRLRDMNWEYMNYEGECKE